MVVEEPIELPTIGIKRKADQDDDIGEVKSKRAKVSPDENDDCDVVVLWCNISDIELVFHAKLFFICFYSYK